MSFRSNRLEITLAATATLVAAAGCLLISGSAAAQDASVLADISPCIGIESAVARLDCYDEIARGTTPGPGRAPIAGEAGDTTTERSTAARAVAPEQQNVATAQSPPDDQIGTVAALREIQPGRLEITLENGEVWRQTNSDNYRLRVGHRVRIYTSRFGGTYRLSADEVRGFIRVERIR